MPKYSYEINISITRLPDDEQVIPPPSPSSDPMARLAEVACRAFSGQQIPFVMPARPSGLTLNRSGNFYAESFPALAKILERFESLAEQVEVENSRT